MQGEATIEPGRRVPHINHKMKRRTKLDCGKKKFFFLKALFYKSPFESEKFKTENSRGFCKWKLNLKLEIIGIQKVHLQILGQLFLVGNRTCGEVEAS